jgi:outer membrane protein assembly factor BamB
MNRARFLLLFSALLILVAIQFGINTGAQTAPDPILGIWSGQLRHDGETQRMTLRFDLDEKKSLMMTFDQPDMKFYNLGPAPVEKQGDEYKAPPMSFRLTPDGKKIVGTMSFDGNDVFFELVPGIAPVPPAPRVFDGRVAQPVWTFKTDGAIWSSPVADEGSVYFGSNDGNIYALKADNGKRLWEAKTGGWVMGRPTIAGEYLYVLSDDGFLYKLEKKTGKTVWKFDTHGGGVKRDMPPNASALDCLGAAATVVGDTIYIGSADKNFYAVDAKTGREMWHFETKDIIRSTPAVVNGAVFFGSNDHNVYALDAKTGTLKWKVDTIREVVSSPLVVDGTVYIGSRSSNLYALDAATGQVKWKFFYWTSFVDSSTVIRDGILYVGSSDYQKVFSINAADGKKVWDFDTDGSSWSTPAVTDKLVYVGAVGSKPDYMTHYGAFFAVDRSTGKLVWRYPMSELPNYPTYGVASSPAIDRGFVFFGGLDGTFYAFRQ